MREVTLQEGVRKLRRKKSKETRLGNVVEDVRELDKDVLNVIYRLYGNTIKGLGTE